MPGAQAGPRPRHFVGWRRSRPDRPQRLGPRPLPRKRRRARPARSRRRSRAPSGWRRRPDDRGCTGPAPGRQPMERPRTAAVEVAVVRPAGRVPEPGARRCLEDHTSGTYGAGPYVSGVRSSRWAGTRFIVDAAAGVARRSATAWRGQRTWFLHCRCSYRRQRPPRGDPADDGEEIDGGPADPGR